MPLIDEAEPLAELLRAAREGRSPVVPERGGASGSVPPPYPQAPAGTLRKESAATPLTVDEVLRRRTSVSRFAAEPLSSDVLDQVRRSGLAAERRQWPYESHGDVGITVAVAAYRVDGLAPGLHLYEDSGNGGPRVTVDVADWLRLLQVKYADAPALLLVCGDLDAACAVHGAAGYPHVLTRCGHAGYAALLSAVSLGLAAAPFGFTVPWPRSVRGLCGDWNRHHLFTVALGAGG
ncbi:hypothetical protein ACWGKQ_45720 [Streptomyces sp. NPDC054770]